MLKGMLKGTLGLVLERKCGIYISIGDSSLSLREGSAQCSYPGWAGGMAQWYSPCLDSPVRGRSVAQGRCPALNPQ